jgi:hypothetical protein
MPAISTTDFSPPDLSPRRSPPLCAAGTESSSNSAPTVSLVSIGDIDLVFREGDEVVVAVAVRGQRSPTSRRRRPQEQRYASAVEA